MTRTAWIVAFAAAALIWYVMRRNATLSSTGSGTTYPKCLYPGVPGSIGGIVADCPPGYPAGSTVTP